MLFGILFNQFADFFEDKILRFFKIKIIIESEKKLKEDLTIDHHDALQLIVYKSPGAYEFLSFRRTMIRIARCFLTATFFLPFIHLIFVLILRFWCGTDLEFSWRNLICFLFSFLFSWIMGKLLIKLYRGYYAAMTNFVLVIREEKK